MPFHMKTPPDQMVGGRDVSLTLHWNPSMGANWAARFNRAQTMLDQEVLRRTDPYVPLDSGLLKDSALLASSIGEGLLVYSTPYAAAQYYNTATTRTYDPQRGGKWFERMKADNADALVAFVRRVMSAQ